jgi:hypothetical protein
MKPHYEYFAESIEECPDIEEFKISNFYLPVAWLEDSVLPTLTSIGEVSVKGITTLQLSNCSLSAADMNAVIKYVADNECLSRLNLSRNDIESVDAVRALAKAIKNHSYLRHVNLAHCSLGGGDLGALRKILFACKDCDSLDIGHADFGSEGAAMVAGFLGKKTSLSAICISAAPLDKESSSLITKNLGKNKSIERLSLTSNDIKLSSILCGTKKVAESLSWLTHLEITSNSLPTQSAKAMAKFFEKAESRLISLNLSKNRISTNAASILLPAIKEHTSIQHLDLSDNRLNDDVVSTIVDLLERNSNLLSLDLAGNKSLKGDVRERHVWDWRERSYKVIPGYENGRSRIVKGALFDTTSLETVANSNHICNVKSAPSDFHEDRALKINALDITEGKKIRYKAVLAINEVQPDLYDPRNFASIPLELMPKLLELVQQELDFQRDSTIRLVPKKSSLNCIYEVVTTWNTPLLFARGAGKLKKKEKAPPVNQKKKSQSKGRKRRKFGDESDDDDEPYIPVGARKRGKRVYNPELNKWEYIPPTVV